MKKLLVLVLVLTVSVFSLFAGGQQEGEAAAAEDETKVLRVTAANWILGKFPVEEAGKRFMKDHPNVKVEVTGFQDYSLNTMMLNWASGDINEDIGFGGTAGQVAKLAYKDLTASWNDFFTGEFAKDNFLSAVCRACKEGQPILRPPIHGRGNVTSGQQGAYGRCWTGKRRRSDASEIIRGPLHVCTKDDKGQW